MKLNHIGLTIRDKEEVELFYQNILGFRFEHHFILDRSLALQIFGIPQSTEAFLLKKENLLIELFIDAHSAFSGYNHVCIEVNDREHLAAKCLAARYPVVRMERDGKPDLLFIKDRTGNIFELKHRD